MLLLSEILNFGQRELLWLWGSWGFSLKLNLYEWLCKAFTVAWCKTRTGCEGLLRQTSILFGQNISTPPHLSLTQTTCYGRCVLFIVIKYCACVYVPVCGQNVSTILARTISFSIIFPSYTLGTLSAINLTSSGSLWPSKHIMSH